MGARTLLRRAIGVAALTTAVVGVGATLTLHGRGPKATA